MLAVLRPQYHWIFTWSFMEKHSLGQVPLFAFKVTYMKVGEVSIA